MRWIHIDDIVELEQGRYARAVRAVPSTADYLEDHYPGFPLVPHSLLIESMAQTGGILVGKSSGYTRDVILAKIERAEFLSLTRPGDRLVIEARMNEEREEGARVDCSITRGGETVARCSLFFAVLPPDGIRDLGARNFVFSGGIFSLFSSIRDSGERAAPSGGLPDAPPEKGERRPPPDGVVE